MYYIWPLILVAVAEVLYQICAKALPADLNPLASITITFVHSAFASILLLLAGYMIFAEGISRNKIIGVAICIVGLIFLNR